jgi:Ca2+/H+ antiporter, TMEM165/GDT1 family
MPSGLPVAAPPHTRRPAARTVCGGPMTFILVALGAAVAVSVELLEALAIVLAVGVTRRWRDALIGAALAAAACGLLAVAVGPVLLASVPLDTLRVVIGVLLLLFGVEWLRKGTLRLAGRRAPASSLAEDVETQEELETAPLPRPGEPDWAARIVAFKGVLLEGIELVLIVAALAARPSGPAPALTGAAVATIAVLGAGAWLRRPLTRIPETQLKWAVGVLLSAFGVFFVAEGLHVHWPGGDLAVLYVGAVLATVSQVQSHRLARQGRPA